MKVGGSDKRGQEKKWQGDGKRQGKGVREEGAEGYKGGQSGEGRRSAGWEGGWRGLGRVVGRREMAE